MTTDVAPLPPPVTALRTLARVGVFVRPYRRQVLFAAVALVVAAGAVLAIGQGLKGVVDRGFGTGDASELDRTLALMLGVVALMAGATFARFYFVSWIGERVTADLRRAVFDHLLTLPPGYYEATRTGDVISRLINDTAMLDTVIGSSASMAIRNVLLLIGGLTMLAVTSAKLTLLVLAGVPLVVVPIILFGRKVRKLARASQDRVGEVGAYVDEALHEVRTVQAYTHEPEDRRRFAARVEAAFGTAVARIRQRAILVASVIMLVFGAVGIILWIGGHDVVAGKLSAGQLSAFVFYAAIVAGAVGTISEVIGDLQRAAGATERLFELLAIEPAIAAPARPLALPDPARGTVSFDRVRFAYPSRPDTPALDDFTLDVAPGEKVALVGPSGAGKTTVFQLLLRFYDPQQGAVRIDGVDVRSADPRAVRGRLAVVPQDPVIFAASVLENVRYGRLGCLRWGREKCLRSGVRLRLHRAIAARLRQRSRRARRAPVRRPAATSRDRARDSRRPPGAAAGRGDERARRRERADGAARARAPDGRAHGADHRPPSRDGAPRRPHRRDGGRTPRGPVARTTSCWARVRSTRALPRCSSRGWSTAAGWSRPPESQ